MVIWSPAIAVLSFLSAMGVMLIATDMYIHCVYRWKQYTLTDNEWGKLRLHEQMLEHGGDGLALPTHINK